MLERSSLREKRDKRYSFPTKRKLSFLSSGSIILGVLLFSLNEDAALGLSLSAFVTYLWTPQHKKPRLHFLEPDRSTQLFRVDELCASLSDSPVECIYFDCSMSCNCIAPADGSSLVIYKSVDLSVSTSFLQYHLDES